MRKRRGLVAACLALACGSPQRPAPTREPTLEIKTYAPLGFKADANAPNLAVILGTDAKDGSTIVPLPAVTDPISVDALFVKLGDPKTIAGAWNAAFVAATTLSKDLTALAISATSTGALDGAAASSLVAAWFLAAVTGAPVDPRVTMIGIVNLDGSIGPVAGIPEALRIAIDSGKKRVGYPIGMRHATSAKTGESVDLVALAKQHGAEAIEIADVHAAYHLLTGTRLPAPVPVSEAEMALDAPTKLALDAKYKQWQQRLAGEWSAILQLESAGRMPAMLIRLRDDAKRHAATAERLHQANLLSAAYARMRTATIYASSANQIYDVLANVQANRIEAAIAALDKLDHLDKQTKDALMKIGALRPTTLGGHLQMIAAFRTALRGWAFKDFAKVSIASTRSYLMSLARTPPATLGAENVADAVVAKVGPTILYVARSVAETTFATEQLELASASSIGYTCSIPNVLRLAASYQSAAAAGVHYIDALLVEPLVQRAQVSLEEARTRMAIAEPDYLVATMASKLGAHEGMAKDLGDAWGETSLPWALVSLSAGELAHFHAAELIAKHASLDVRIDESRQVAQSAHDKALAHMLATAERNARASARAARIATGAIPVQAKLAYQLAIAEREGSLDDKLDALAQFWTASALSQTAVMLARN